MSWEEELFAVLEDLEHQADGMFAAERELEVADRSRAEYHQVTLASRLMATLGEPVTLEVLGIGQVAGTLQRVGAEWCLLRGGGQEWVVPSGALVGVLGPSPRSVPEVAWSPLHRLGLASALRRIADAGGHCVVHLVNGRHQEARLIRVGRDFAEAVVGEDRTVLIPFATLAAVQSRPDLTSPAG